MSTPQTAAERLADCLKQGGKTQGLKVPVYRVNRETGQKTLDHYATQKVEVMAADIVEVAAQCGGQASTSIIVKHLHMGSSHPLAAAGKVTVQADDVFHLLAQVPKPAMPDATG